jgi:hypothetical protein
LPPPQPAATSASRATRLALQDREDLVLLGEAPGALLREDELTVGDDVELALLAGRDRGLDAPVVQRGRETRGPDVVPVSDGAKKDVDCHGAKA